jgi:Pro-kumamolisin, activation domain
VLRAAARFISVVIVLLAMSATPGSAVASSTKVNFGDISHKGLKKLGAASTSLKLSLEIGMITNQQGIANAVKAASNPSSKTYGQYLSLSTLQKKYGASSSRRKAVVGAFKSYGVTATVDVTHLRVSATISIKHAQKLFGTKWDLYATGQKNQAVALPVNKPKLVSGLKGNVDVVSGLELYVTHHGSSSSSVSSATQLQAAAVDGGTPTRTGTINPGCATTTYPAAVVSSAGLFPNQILNAYGIAQLHTKLGSAQPVAHSGWPAQGRRPRSTRPPDAWRRSVRRHRRARVRCPPAPALARRGTRAQRRRSRRQCLPSTTPVPDGRPGLARRVAPSLPSRARRPPRRGCQSDRRRADAQDPLTGSRAWIGSLTASRAVLTGSSMASGSELVKGVRNTRLSCALAGLREPALSGA